MVLQPLPEQWSVIRDLRVDKLVDNYVIYQPVWKPHQVKIEVDIL